jgi:hypothetical protein
MILRHVSYKGFEFYIPEPEQEEGNADDVGMQHWFDSSLRSTLTYAEQVWYVNSFIHDCNLSILEVFCGFGMSTITIDSSRIEQHIAFDHDEGCANAFQFLRPDSKTFVADSYSASPIALGMRQFDCVYIEYNAMTTYRAMQDPKERYLLDLVFNSNPRYVIFVDSAKVKEHLHRGTYSKFFDYTIDSSDGYVHAVDKFFKQTYGYHIKACAHDNINYTMLFERSGGIPPYLQIVDTRTMVDISQFKDLGYIDVDF